jgi:hypothetical protein
MVKIDNLLEQLVRYNEKDRNITGNPEITFFAVTTNNIRHRRHSNFTFGLIDIEPTNKTTDSICWNNFDKTGDILLEIIICLKKISDFIKLVISIGDHDPIELSLEYIQVYNLNRQIIFESETDCLVTFNLVELLYSDKMPITCFYSGLPIIFNKLKINWIYLNTKESDSVLLKLKACLLDTDERRCFSSETRNNLKKSKLLCLEYPKYLITHKNNKLTNISDVNLSSSYYYDLKPNSQLPTIKIFVKIKNFDLFESIEIKIDSQTIVFGKYSILIYDKFFKQIIYEHLDYKIIVLTVINQLSKLPDNYNLKINYSNNFDDELANAVISCLNVNEVNAHSNLIYSDNIFSGYYEYVFDLKKIDLDNKIILNNYQNYLTHIAEIFIWFKNKKTNQNERIIDKFNILIDSVSLNFTDLDTMIYSKTNYKIYDNSVYTITFALMPINSNPTGLFNTFDKPIEIELNYKNNICKSDYEIGIVLFGYKSYLKVSEEISLFLSNS